MNIIQKPINESAPYANDAKNVVIRPGGVCIHVAGGNGLIEWAASPDNMGASWHYGIYKDGGVYSFVPDNKFAWGNGMYWEGDIPFNPQGIQMGLEPLAQIIYDKRPINPNMYLISIEHQGFTSEAWTNEMYNADARLIIYLSKKYKFPIDRYHVVGHNEIDCIDRSNCPGKGFSFDRLFEEIKNIQSPKPDNLHRVYKNNKQLGAYKIKDNAFQKFIDLKADKVILNNKNITSEFKNAMKQLEKARKEYSELKTMYNEIQSGLKAKEIQIQDMEDTIKNLKKENKKYSDAVDLLRKQLNETNKKLLDDNMGITRDSILIRVIKKFKKVLYKILHK